jgi:signal transduction histidine kinase
MKLTEMSATIEEDFFEASSIRFNGAYMESVFLNLLTNSLRYAHPNRHPFITIKTTKAFNGNVKLVYTDNGMGMDMQRVKHKIFGLYQRFSNNPDSKGMGLYLIHSQITSLGGTIEVDSELGVGTVFTINFK